MKSTHFIICFVILLLKENADCAMTEAQVKAAGKMLRNVCQPKSKITNAQIDAFHQGTFTPEPEVMNYMECVLRTGQIMKDAAINMDSLSKQLANLPPALAQPSIDSVEHCKDVKTSDKFEAAYGFYKCMYEDNPVNFFLP